MQLVSFPDDGRVAAIDNDSATGAATSLTVSWTDALRTVTRSVPQTTIGENGSVAITALSSYFCVLLLVLISPLTPRGGTDWEELRDPPKTPKTGVSPYSVGERIVTISVTVIRNNKCYSNTIGNNFGNTISVTVSSHFFGAGNRL